MGGGWLLLSLFYGWTALAATVLDLVEIGLSECMTAEVIHLNSESHGNFMKKVGVSLELVVWKFPTLRTK
jgi:hypothetical protein